MGGPPETGFIGGAGIPAWLRTFPAQALVFRNHTFRATEDQG